MSRVEREAITDSVLKIESIQASLEQLDEAKIPEVGEIQNCLELSDQKLRDVLKEDQPQADPASRV
ncbi:MAG TPA: hypothetical protein VGF16_03835 [Bryobacteraceae bacterium]